MRSPTASTACRRIAARDCAGQATVEFALVTVAFLSVVLGMGALWRSVSAGAFVEHALSCASHCVTGSLPGALADTVLLLSVQPGMVLYDRMVMRAAASDACRLAAAKTDAVGDSSQAVEAFVRHRLGAIPPVSCFHVHDGGCSWEVSVQGDERSERVSVEVVGKVKPLPFLDAGAVLLSMTDGDGLLTVKARCERATQPEWVAGSPQGLDPEAWIGAWL